MGAPLARGRDRGAASRRTFIPQQLSTLGAATTPRKDSAGAWVWPSQLLMVPAGTSSWSLGRGQVACPRGLCQLPVVLCYSHPIVTGTSAHDTENL